MHPPMIKLPPKEWMAPEGYLVLNEDGTYQFEPPGDEWKSDMLEIVGRLCALMTFMARQDGISLEAFEEAEGVYECRSRVALAMWNSMNPGDSVCLARGFEAPLCEMYMEESNSCWMPEVLLGHSKKVFAYFYHYVVGAGNPEEQSKLHTALLAGIKKVDQCEAAKTYLRTLMKELYITESFCAGSYTIYQQARGMKIPWL